MMASTTTSSQTLPVKNVMILGATGNMGSRILAALQDHNNDNPSNSFNITILTRTSSYAKTTQQIPSSPNLQILHIDNYTNAPTLSSLLQDHNVEVLISTVATMSTNDQNKLIDACISSGTVRRFFPSEYGIDTSNRALVEQYVPIALLKLENIEYLRQVCPQTNGRFTWSAIIVGAFFDWALALPNVLAFDIGKMSTMVIDGGDVKYEATNVGQIARAVVACLTSEKNFEETKDQYVYVNSFTTTQNEVISVVERLTGKTMNRIDISAQELSKKALAMYKELGGLKAYRAYEPTPEKPYAPGSGESIWAGIYGGEKTGGLNQYSMREPGLWNERLGLPKEDFEETLRGVVEGLGILKKE